MKPVPIALRLLVASALTATATAAVAEDPPILHLAEAETARSHSDAWRRWADDFSRDMRVSMSTMYGGRMGSHKTVKGAPYSADVVTELNQTLGDGNVITKTTAGRVYRDGEGRTRQESGGDGKNPTIYISDPVEKKDIVLAPGSKKAIVSPRHDFTYNLHDDKRVMKFGPTEVRIEGVKVFVDGKEFPDGKVELKSAGKDIRIENGKVTVDGKEVPGGRHRVIVKDTADGTRREEVRIQIVHDGETRDMVIPPVPPVPPVPAMPAMPPMSHFDMSVPQLPGAHTMRFESTAKLGKGTTAAMGTKDFDGVKAEGKSTVWVIPAGQIGNKNPIQVTSESWYSPELQLTVYSRHNDPRMGESIYRLAALKRGEPSAELFKAPEDYAVKKRGK